MSANIYKKALNANAKKTLLISSICLLAACGGGGGGDSSGSNTNSNNNSSNNTTVNIAPSNVVIKNVITNSPTVILVEWDSAIDDKTLASDLVYEVHLIEGTVNDFTPSEATRKFSGKNILNTSIAGLKAQTTYTVKLIALDSQGAKTISVPKAITTLAENNPPINQAPTNVSLNKVSGLSTTSLSIEWSTASDDTTSASKLIYEVHITEGLNDFEPNATTLRKSLQNVLSTQIDDLKVQTNYSVKLLVKDEQGLATASQKLTTSTLNSQTVSMDKINDTGITVCANDNTIFSQCNISNLGSWFNYQQDGQIGRDALAAQKQLKKMGSGNAGFDFSKLNTKGEVLADTASSWQCVKDNLTGLIWEVKTADKALHDGQQTYSWYNTDTNTNGGFIGEEKVTNTQAFIKSVNQAALCGFSDWRLPTRQELESIIDYGQTSLTIDSKIFINIQAKPYWTSVTVSSSPTSAWAINMADASDGQHYKGNMHHVMLVRGGQ